MQRHIYVLHAQTQHRNIRADSGKTPSRMKDWKAAVSRSIFTGTLRLLPGNDTTPSIKKAKSASPLDISSDLTGRFKSSSNLLTTATGFTFHFFNTGQLATICLLFFFYNRRTLHSLSALTSSSGEPDPLPLRGTSVELLVPFFTLPPGLSKGLLA